jgi:Fe-S oxidoreductase
MLTNNKVAIIGELSYMPELCAMKVLFIYSLDDFYPSKKPLHSWSGIHFGISYIASVLSAHGHQTQLLILGRNYYEDGIKQIKSTLDDFNPTLVCFTAVYSQYFFIERVARFIKDQWPDKYLIIGGAHATLQPEGIISGPFDALCIGEGEYPTLELCNQLASQQQPQGIANLWIKRPDGSIEKNSTREFIQDLDSLPYPNHEMWKPWIKIKDNDEMAILAGRGCPYNCTYCSNHALRKVAAGKYVRTRSPENILEEIIFIYNNYPHRKIAFEIETLDCFRDWTTQLCDKLRTFNASIRDPITYSTNYRINPNTIDKNLFKELEKANFKAINIGLESGNERIRSNILKRNYSNNDFFMVVSLAREHGLKIFVYNMIGLPEESLHDHKETVQLNRQCQPDGHYTGIYYPYPGTELYDYCVQKGLIQKSSVANIERRQAILCLPNFSKFQIKRAYTWFDYHVYKGHKPLLKLLYLVVSVKINSNPKIMHFVHKVTGYILALILRIYPSYRYE